MRNPDVGKLSLHKSQTFQPSILEYSDLIKPDVRSPLELSIALSTITSKDDVVAFVDHCPADGG